MTSNPAADDPPPVVEASVFSLPLGKKQAPHSAVSSLKSSPHEDDPVSRYLLGEFFEDDLEATEEDLTETERASQGDDHAVIAPVVVQEYYSPLPEDNNNNERNTAFLERMESYIEEEVLDDEEEEDDDNLVPVAHLLDLLASANRPDAHTRRRRLRDPNRQLNVEDLTHILTHLNTSEQADTDPRWDVIHELAYGFYNHTTAEPRRRSSRRPAVAATDDEASTEEGMCILDARSNGSSRLPKLPPPEEEHDMPVAGPAVEDDEADELDEEGEGHARPPARRVPPNRSDSASLSLTDVMPSRPEESGSAFTLDACTHSVASSVTWFEGADMTEIEISEDELEEFLPRLRSDANDEEDSGEDDSLASSRASTPPPPIDAAILYTPPFDFISCSEEDSLSKCYRRRRPRRYDSSPDVALE
jgi:hypothetical protein